MPKGQSIHKYFGIPIQKWADADEEGTILVEGYFTSDRRDELNDTITREATEGAIPQYRRWSNVRFMHQPFPVGRVIRIGKDDGMEWNGVEIRVIHPDAVFAVKNGLVTALSVGIIVSWDDMEWDEENSGFIINAYKLAEISLVDHPANYDAFFSQVRGTMSYLTHTKGIDAARQYLSRVKEDYKNMPDELIETRDVQEPATEDAITTEQPIEGEQPEDNLEVDKSVIPYKDTGKADKGQSWSKPDLSDFTSESFEDLSSAEKRRIAAHYTFTVNSPPNAFGDLKLPHHNASKDGIGPAVWRGVANAMARLNQTAGMSDADKDGCYNHLAKHYKQFDEEPPEKGMKFDLPYPEDYAEPIAEVVETPIESDVAEVVETPTEPEVIEVVEASAEPEVVEVVETPAEPEVVEVVETPIEPQITDALPPAEEIQQAVIPEEIQQVQPFTLDADVINLFTKTLQEIQETLKALAKVLPGAEAQPTGEGGEESKQLRERVEALETENKDLKAQLEALQLPDERKGKVQETVLPEVLETEEEEPVEEPADRRELLKRGIKSFLVQNYAKKS